MDEEMQRLARTGAERLDSLLARAPDIPHAEIREAVDCVTAFRNRAIEKHRGGAVSRACLDRANALVSLAFGAEFPLSGLHLRRIEGVRDGLRDLLRDGSEAPSPD